MSRASRDRKQQNPRIVLGLLEALERNGAQSQRHLAAELGIALGLVNAYIKRCIRKGLLKVSEAPARRYAYYLTPRGFSEKSRLTIEYLSSSLSFFRSAKSDCKAALDAAQSLGFKRIVLAGVSDLAEIAIICAMDTGLEIIAIVDPDAADSQFLGYPVVGSFDKVRGFEGVLVTDIDNPIATYALAMARVG